MESIFLSELISLSYCRYSVYDMIQLYDIGMVHLREYIDLPSNVLELIRIS